jgi:hypothetical protein
MGMPVWCTSPVRTARIDAQLEREIAGEDHARAVALIDQIGTELDMWKIVSQNDTVEAAALTYANGDLERLERAVALALRDWRDLLVLVRGG